MADLSYEYCNIQATYRHGSNDPYFILPRYDDISFVSICVPFGCNFDDIDNLVITANSMTIWRIPFSLIVQLSKVECTNKHKIIYLHDNLFFDGATVNYLDACIPIYKLQYSVIDVYLECKNKIVCSLCIKKVYRKCSMLCDHHVAKNNNAPDKITLRINQYDKHNFKNSCKWSIPNLSNSTGFFIECEKMSAISIIICNINAMTFDEDIVDIYVKKIHSYWTDKHSIALIESLSAILSRDIAKHIETFVDKSSLYWVPFTICKEWYDNVVTCDFIWPDNKFVEFNKEQSGTLYVLKKNALVIECGLCNFAFV